MVRDFIPLDSDNAKEVLKATLEMTEGDFSGNKLGLSSKVVPVVPIGFMDYKERVIREADIAEGQIVSIVKRLVNLLGVGIFQTNTETNAKNFTLHGETLSGVVVETQLSIADNTYYDVGLFPTSDTECDVVYTWNISAALWRLAGSLYLKNIWVRQDSADGTAQDIKIKFIWSE